MGCQLSPCTRWLTAAHLWLHLLLLRTPSPVMPPVAVRFVSDETLILQPSTASGSPSTASSSPSTASSNGPAGAPRSQLQPGPAHEQPSTAGTASCRHDSPAQPCQRRLHVPRGSILCICPMESHHDPRLYPNDPWAFKPDRWVDLWVDARDPGLIVGGLVQWILAPLSGTLHTRDELGSQKTPDSLRDLRGIVFVSSHVQC